MTLAPRLDRLLNGALTLELVALIAGSALAFGGVVWWMKPTVGALVVALALTCLLRATLAGRIIVLRSPLTGLGVLAIGLAVFQTVQWPGRIAALISPAARSAYALELLPDRALADDPSVELPAVVAGPTAATIDRSATLRWIGGAMACLTLFWACSQFADRWRHTAIILGCVVAAFFIGTIFGLAQILGNVSGLYGAIEPGRGAGLTPSTVDALVAPGQSVLRPMAESSESAISWSLQRPEILFQFGTMIGGADAFLALASLGLPLALGLTLQALAPRGSREPMAARLRTSGRGGLVAMMVLMTPVAAAMAGYLGGPILAIVFGVTLAFVGFPATRISGLRWIGAFLTLVTIGAVASGHAMASRNAVPAATNATTVANVKAAWLEGLREVRAFPLAGAGMGTYPTLAAYYKSTDATPNTARSSLVQWLVESGIVGLTLVALGTLWILVKIPRAIGRVGGADKTMAYALAGTLGCFVAVSAVHWTVELIAVALASAAVGGICNRWLAGGTDLLVETA